jgi:hypothetical protein
VWDVRNSLVSLAGAEQDYGVVIKDGETLEVDAEATRQRRGNRAPTHAVVREPTTLSSTQKTPAAKKPVAVKEPSRPARTKSAVVDERLPERPPPLTGADVGYIKIVDFSKTQDEEKRKNRGMKIRYF